jgi:hypothetical protein
VELVGAESELVRTWDRQSADTEGFIQKVLKDLTGK